MLLAHHGHSASLEVSWLTAERARAAAACTATASPAACWRTAWPATCTCSTCTGTRGALPPPGPAGGGALPWAAHVRPAQRRGACAAQSRGLLRCKAARRAPALGRMRWRSPSEVGLLAHVLCELNMLFRRSTLAVSTSPFLWRGVSWNTAYAAVCWRWAARRGQRAALTCCSPSAWCAHYLCMSGHAGVAVPADHTAQRRCWPCTMTMARSCTW